MRVVAAGSRTFTNRQIVFAVLQGLLEVWASIPDEMDFHLATGEAKGADTLAKQWAWKLTGSRHFSYNPYPADWSLGKAAGPIRNEKMLKEFQPDVVVAFIDKPLAKSRGTHDLVTKAVDIQVNSVYVIHADCSIQFWDFLSGEYEQTLGTGA